MSRDFKIFGYLLHIGAIRGATAYEWSIGPVYGGLCEAHIGEGERISLSEMLFKSPSTKNTIGAEMKFDDRKMLRVAQIVQRFNASQKDNSVEHIVSQMKQAAALLGHGKGYVSMGGYVLSAYISDDGAVCIHPSVSDVLYDEIMAASPENA